MSFLDGTKLDGTPTPWVLWFVVVILILVAILIMFLSALPGLIP